MYCNRQYSYKIYFATIHKQINQSSGKQVSVITQKKKKSERIKSASKLRNPYYSTLQLKSQIFWGWTDTNLRTCLLKYNLTFNFVGMNQIPLLKYIQRKHQCCKKPHIYFFTTSMQLQGKYQVCCVNTYYLWTSTNTLGILFEKGRSSIFF